VFYGGWGDYQLWADHDFRPRASVEGPEKDDEPSRPTDSSGRLLPLAPPPTDAGSWSVQRTNSPAASGSWPALPDLPSADTEQPAPPKPRATSPTDSGSWPAPRTGSPTDSGSWPALPVNPMPAPRPAPRRAITKSPPISPLADEGPWPPPPPVPPPEPGESRQIVRPYTRTGGRTRQAHRLELETLLSTPLGREVDVATLRSDLRAICVACRMPQSTAEVAARLGLPLGAARVLIGDVVDLGLLYVHETTGEDGPSLDLLNRVYAGLRKMA